MRLPNIPLRMGMSPRAGWAFLGTCVLLGGSALVLASSALALTAAATRSDAAAVRDLSAAASLGSRRTQPAGPDEASAGSGAVSAFQSFVEEQAAQRKCSVAEFQVSSDAHPFISRFETHGVARPWMQVEVMFSVKGRLSEVYEVIASVSKQAVAFEPNSVEIARDSVSDAGSATVAARVLGRVLQRGGGGK